MSKNIVPILDRCQRCGVAFMQDNLYTVAQGHTEFGKTLQSSFQLITEYIPYFSILRFLSKFMSPNHVQYEYERNGDQKQHLKFPRLILKTVGGDLRLFFIYFLGFSYSMQTLFGLLTWTTWILKYRIVVGLLVVSRDLVLDIQGQS